LSFASSRKSSNAITSSSFRNCFPSPRTRGKTCLSSLSTDTEKGSTQQRENDDGNERKSVQLLRAINDAKKRNSGGDDDGKIFALMDELEKEAETVEKDMDLIDGKFSLLFTGGATKAKEEEREKKEGAIGSFVTRVTGSSSSSSSSARMKKTKSSSSSDSSKNFQIIDLANEVVENRAELLLFNRVPVSVRIFGSCVRKQSPSTRPRFSVCFTHAKIEVAGKERIQIPLTRFNARGWIDVTYVDELIRLGVGDKGSRFVTARLRRNSD